MWLYFHKSVELATQGKGHSQQEIAEAAGLSVFQVSRWHQHPEFHQALAATHRHVQLVGFERAMNALLRLAERGNVLAFTTVRETLERIGRIATVVTGDAQASAPGTAINGVQIHIHQIPEPAPRSTLPPALELPATSAASSTLPAK